jgi:hypothetical protein
MKRKLTNALRDERGIALVMAMGVLLVISVSLVGVIYFTSANARTSNYSKSAQSAVAIAEAGINNALAAITDPANAGSLDNPTWLGSSSQPFTSTYPGGTVSWYGEFRWADDTHPFWLVTATATVRNPTGPSAAPIRRTLTMKVPLKPPPQVAEAADIWNWIYTNRTGYTCDMTVDQAVALASPLFVKGNLCLKSTAWVSNGPLIVGGNLTLVNPQNSVGTSSQPLTNAVRIGGWCQYKNFAAVSPCAKESHTPATNVFATNFSNSPSDYKITLPPVWWWRNESPDGEEGWYEKASPGPRFPCDTVTGTPPTFEVAGDTLMNANVPGVFDLAPPASSYTCITRRGQLSWNNVTRTLTLRGTIFIDGSAVIQNNSGPIRYVQMPACTVPPAPGDTSCSAGAVLYLAGTMMIKNSVVCGGALNAPGNDCDMSTAAAGQPLPWDPNINLFVVAAHGQGGQCPVGTSICVVSSSFQGALYGKAAIDAGTTSRTQGPLVSETEVKVGQTNGVQFPQITITPIGMPGYAPWLFSALDPEYG